MFIKVKKDNEIKFVKLMKCTSSSSDEYSLNAEDIIVSSEFLHCV